MRKERHHRQLWGSVDTFCLRSSVSRLRSEGASGKNPKGDVQGCTSPHWGFRQIRCCGRALAGGKPQQWQLQKLPLPNPPLRFAQRRVGEQQQQLLLWA